MKNIYTLLVATMLCITAMAQTSIPGGLVSGTWTLAGSPYLVQGSIQINNGTTLTIQPGVSVIFQGSYKLNVQGCLIAIGNINDTITFSVPISDTATGWLGVVFNNTLETNDSSKISYCKIQYGNVTSTSLSIHDGGGIYFYNFSNAIVSHCLITRCQARTDGGGIYIYGCNPLIEFNTITNNIAGTANGHGAGICLDYSSSVINENVISYNYFTGVSPGGGIYIIGGTPTITNNIISNNNANWNPGGGISINNSTAIILNNVISNNYAHDDGASGGGGIWCSASNATFINNTIVNNVSDINSGGGIAIIGCSPIFQNCIIWGDTSLEGVNDGPQVSLFDAAAQPSFYYCDIEGGTSEFDLNGNIYVGTYQNNINMNPMFVSPSAGTGTAYNGVAANWQLQTSSPCIDKGDPFGTYPATDLAGNPRIVICRIDIGAYENQYGISSPFLINPPATKTVYCEGLMQLDSITTNYSATGLTYIWSSSDTVPNPIVNVINDTTYYVTVTTPSGCAALDSVMITLTPLTASVGSDQTIICGGVAQLDNVTTNYTGTGTLTYNWSPLAGLSDSTIQNPIAIVTNNTTYFVTVTTPNGCTATSSVNVNVNPLTINVSNTSTSCGTPVTLSTTNNYSGSGTLTYNWQPTNGLSDATISNPSANLGTTTTYTVSLTTPNGCVATNQVTVTLNPLPVEQICYVEFDSATFKNSIVWPSNLPANIDSVHIYNETSTNTYSLIGATSASQGHFIDINSNPDNQSYTYKISVEDTCGIETDSSVAHTTVTLLGAYNTATNTYGFTWSAYIGLSISDYYLYGIMSDGTETLIGTVLGNQYFYNYTSPNLNFIKFFVGFNTSPCISTGKIEAGVHHLVKSNWVQNTVITNINEPASLDNLISIYPNPVTDNLQIQTTLPIKEIAITDITGRLLYTTTAKTINCSSFAKGVYFIKATTSEGAVVKKFIKE